MIARSGLADVLAALGDFFGTVLGGYQKVRDAAAAIKSEIERVE